MYIYIYVKNVSLINEGFRLLNCVGFCSYAHYSQMTSEGVSIAPWQFCMEHQMCKEDLSALKRTAVKVMLDHDGRALEALHAVLYSNKVTMWVTFGQRIVWVSANMNMFKCDFQPAKEVPAQ